MAIAERTASWQGVLLSGNSVHGIAAYAPPSISSTWDTSTETFHAFRPDKNIKWIHAHIFSGDSVDAQSSQSNMSDITGLSQPARAMYDILDAMYAHIDKSYSSLRPGLITIEEYHARATSIGSETSQCKSPILSLQGFVLSNHLNPTFSFY